MSHEIAKIVHSIIWAVAVVFVSIQMRGCSDLPRSPDINFNYDCRDAVTNGHLPRENP